MVKPVCCPNCNMKIAVICPNCGRDIPVVSGIGRQKLNIGVKNICDTLEMCRDIRQAAEQLGCSRAYIYRELSKYGAKPKEVMQGNYSNLSPVAK